MGLTYIIVIMFIYIYYIYNYLDKDHKLEIDSNKVSMYMF